MMKHFNDEAYANILSSGGIKVADYIKGGYKENLLLRLLHKDDYNKGFMELMFDNSKAGHAEQRKVFRDYLSACDSCPGMYYTIVIEDLRKTKIIACGTLIVEQKFIHGTALRGRIENIFVNVSHRRRRVGSVLISSLSLLAEKVGCYKATLNCSEDVVQFCEKMKYVGEPGQNFMIIYFDKDPNVDYQIPSVADAVSPRGTHSKM